LLRLVKNISNRPIFASLEDSPAKKLQRIINELPVNIRRQFLEESPRRQPGQASDDASSDETEDVAVTRKHTHDASHTNARPGNEIFSDNAGGATIDSLTDLIDLPESDEKGADG
jgi:hypothetical protein